MQALKGMDTDENFRRSMHRAFKQVCLAPINGSVLTLEPPIFFRFTGCERNGGLAAQARGVFAKMISRQLDDQVLLSDILDDSNLLRNNTPQVEEEDVPSDSEGKGEGSGEE